MKGRFEDLDQGQGMSQSSPFELSTCSKLYPYAFDQKTFFFGNIAAPLGAGVCFASSSVIKKHVNACARRPCVYDTKLREVAYLSEVSTASGFGEGG
ncbi:hypothetical protein HI914_04774 [Erysiphe necator]|nr:hypothetical protein HI914_04774 [Erysiphe necator]